MNYSLTPKQQKFVNEFLIDFNATQAAKRAGYEGNHLKNIGWQCLKHPDIRASIDRQLGERQFNYIATIKSIQRILHEFVSDPDLNIPDKIKSASLLTNHDELFNQLDCQTFKYEREGQVVPHDHPDITADHEISPQVWCQYDYKLVDKCCCQDFLDQQIENIRKQDERIRQRSEQKNSPPSNTED